MDRFYNNLFLLVLSWFHPPTFTLEMRLVVYVDKFGGWRLIGIAIHLLRVHIYLNDKHIDYVCTHIDKTLHCFLFFFA